MKKFCYPLLFLISVLTLLLYSCSSSDNSEMPNASSYSSIKQKALNSLTQHFEFNTADQYGTFISEKGVTINIIAAGLTLNGNPVVGQIDIEYIEIFDGGTMAATGKHTMGLLSDGNHSVLLSGGEFYINASKNGQQLELEGGLTLQIPTTLTDAVGGNPDMTLWNLTENDSVWIPNVDIDISGANGVFLEQQQNGGTGVYYAYFNHFGWTNVDCFYEDPREKTTILASVPIGYDNQNSTIYLHYDGKGNALALLDTYDSQTGLFSEHYGQIPIGLECHVIFVSESNGQYRYAIKQATITAGAVYNFALSETIVGSQAQMIAAIDALP